MGWWCRWHEARAEAAVRRQLVAASRRGGAFVVEQNPPPDYDPEPIALVDNIANLLAACDQADAKAWVEPKPRGVDAMSDDVRDTMTGPEHYAKALLLVAYPGDSVLSRADASAMAQAHAALAIAATFGTETAYGPSSREMRETRAEWAAVLANTRTAT